MAKNRNIVEEVYESNHPLEFTYPNTASHHSDPKLEAVKWAFCSILGIFFTYSIVANKDSTEISVEHKDSKLNISAK